MLPLRAEIRTDAPILDERSAARRTLRLEVAAVSAGDVTRALIHNLSESGLLIETSADLQVGETLQVELPHAGSTTALVIWRRGLRVGCEFVSPVSKAAVSAALLRNPIDSPTVPPTRTELQLDGLLNREVPVESQLLLFMSLLLWLLVAVGTLVGLLVI